MGSRGRAFTSGLMRNDEIVAPIPFDGRAVGKREALPRVRSNTEAREHVSRNEGVNRSRIQEEFNVFSHFRVREVRNLKSERRECHGAQFYAVAAIAGRYVQIGSEANTSPVTDQALDLDPPQSSRNSQTPHFPFRLFVSRRLTKIGLLR